ncbi:MAG: TM2 domain-containing protein [Clostridia bacterium]|nr:TM2 domain-containing protein [Clostridia bacterium]
MKNKMVAALLAFFLGAIGAHHFYLGQTKIGVIKLIFFWTYIPTFLGIFDAIKLFVMSDDAFCSKYKCRLG